MPTMVYVVGWSRVRNAHSAVADIPGCLLRKFNISTDTNLQSSGAFRSLEVASDGLLNGRSFGTHSAAH